MSWYEWGPYVSVAERRRKAQQELKRRGKKGAVFSPVVIEGRTIATSFWGKSWCTNLERYSDYASRLPRGRSYVRNGSVIDLQIKKGEVLASVSGSSLYTVKIAIAPVKARSWKSICRDCAGSIDSLVELLQGRLAKGVMDRVCREGDGLFPSPREIELSCSCPDWADMCKHVAATLYGVGARLDAEPQLLFLLRGVNESDLLSGAGADVSIKRPGSAAVLKEDNVAALFGLEMAESADGDASTAAEDSPARTPARPARRAKKAQPRKNGKSAGVRNATTAPDVPADGTRAGARTTRPRRVRASA